MDLKYNKSINNWYYQKIKQNNDLCKHMENISLQNNNLKKNKSLIEAFKNQQINDINDKYIEKIENYNKKKNLINNDNSKKRNDALDFIIKNKIFLESIGEDKCKIEKYCNEQYNFINNKFLHKKKS
jgi:hypothetical protein